MSVSEVRSLHSGRQAQSWGSVPCPGSFRSPIRSLPLPQKTCGAQWSRAPDVHAASRGIAEFSEGFVRDPGLPVPASAAMATPPGLGSEVLRHGFGLVSGPGNSSESAIPPAVKPFNFACGGALRGKVLEILSSAHGREQAQTAFELNEYAPTSRATKDSQELTLSMFAEALGIQLLPLETSALSVIFGAMRMAGYASSETYVSAARVAHARAGYPISDGLRLFLRGAERAMIRGRGPSQKAATFDFCELGNCFDLGSSMRRCEVSRSPQLPWASLAVATWWMLRTIELLWIRVGGARLHSDPIEGRTPARCIQDRHPRGRKIPCVRMCLCTFGWRPGPAYLPCLYVGGGGRVA